MQLDVEKYIETLAQPWSGEPWTGFNQFGRFYVPRSDPPIRRMHSRI